MAFVNTRDTIGDRATVDGLVEHSLTELKEDGIGIVETYACYKNTGLQSVEFPGVSQVKANAFDGCSNLEVVKLGGEGSSNSLSIATNAFNGCSKMKHLVIDRPVMATLATTSGLNGTPIALGEGAVYVPESLLDTYKANSVWKNYFITKLQKYPLSSFDTIEDDWATIFANSSYATDYPIAGYKTLELTDGTKIKMDLAAIDTDDKSDNSGKAKMTWISHGIIGIYPMNLTATTSGGWADSEMRSYLISDILSKIPTEIKSHIVSVKKSYRTKSPNDETLWSDDEIWIPSCKEVRITDTSYVENDGAEYGGLFSKLGSSASDKHSRIYLPSPIGGYWWLRSAYNSTDFCWITAAGSFGHSSATTNKLTSKICSGGVVFGFCTD